MFLFLNRSNKKALVRSTKLHNVVHYKHMNVNLSHIYPRNGFTTGNNHNVIKTVVFV